MKVLSGISQSDDIEIVIEMILYPSYVSSKIALVPGQYMVCFFISIFYLQRWIL